MKPKQSGTAKREKLDAYYTKESVVNEIVSHPIFSQLVQEIGCVVDCSAGDDRFANAIKRSNSAVTTLSFDINPMSESVTRRDWFDVSTLPANYILGLNPPFGRQSSGIIKFIRHALSVNPPAAIVMIHPTNDCVTPSGYEELLNFKLQSHAFVRNSNGSPFDFPCDVTFMKRLQGVETHSFAGVNKRPKESSTLEWVRYTRVGNLSDRHRLLVRRTGANFLRTAYIVRKTKPEFMVIEGHVRACSEFKHNVNSEVFFKFEILDQTIDIQSLACALTTCDRLDSDKQKRPPSTTNEHVNNILAAFKATTKKLNPL
jgi:hypothetical protein